MGAWSPHILFIRIDLGKGDLTFDDFKCSYKMEIVVMC